MERSCPQNHCEVHSKEERRPSTSVAPVAAACDRARSKNSIACPKPISGSPPIGSIANWQDAGNWTRSRRACSVPASARAAVDGCASCVGKKASCRHCDDASPVPRSTHLVPTAATPAELTASADPQTPSPSSSGRMRSRRPGGVSTGAGGL
eukprot:6707847-Prymnesium_polylepis.1